MTCGGARSGYCAIGSVGIASAPASVRMIEQTAAKTGRRMKNSTNIAASARRVARAGNAVAPAWAVTYDRRAVAQHLQRRDRDPIAGRQAALDPVCRLAERAELDRPPLDHRAPSRSTTTKTKVCPLWRWTARTGTCIARRVVNTTRARTSSFGRRPTVLSKAAFTSTSWVRGSASGAT